MLGLLPLALTAGCNQYEYFALAGYEQLSFSNDADVLFVIDNSISMQPYSSDVAINFNTFIDTLASGEGTPTTENLSDAVDNYLRYVSERGSFMDYQLAITTTSVDETAGPTPNLDPGEAGLLTGDPSIIEDNDANIADTFRYNLLCESACWSEGDLPDDPKYLCGDPPTQVSPQYLNCVCGPTGWGGTNTCGAGTEEHLEAALLAMCRAVDNPPAECFDTVMGQDEVLTNDGLLRDDAATVIVFITDEGDTSRRLTGNNPLEDVQPYVDLFDKFDRNIKFAAVGVPYDGQSLVCNQGGATSWGIARLQTLTQLTGGFYNPIAEQRPGATDPDDCVPTDFATHLNDLGELLQNLLTAFQLRSIPDESTIRAFIDGEEIAEAELLSGEAGTTSAQYGDGWAYDPSRNSVVFWGDAIPDYNQKVNIYYRPLEGKPRELPF